MDEEFACMVGSHGSIKYRKWAENSIGRPVGQMESEVNKEDKQRAKEQR